MTGLGGAYGRTGPLEKAIACYEDALALARAQSDKQKEACALHGLGWCYGDLGEQSKAIEVCQRALASYQDLGDKSGEALRPRQSARATSLDLADRPRPSNNMRERSNCTGTLETVRGNAMPPITWPMRILDSGNNAEASRLAGDALQMAQTIGYRLIECGATSLLADLMVRETRFEDAIREYDKACALADDSNALEMQLQVRRDLAWACLLAGDLPRARTVAEEATKHRFPSDYGSVLALDGVVALRQGETAAASKAFDMTLREADAQLAGTARAYSSAYARALALAGLTLCRDPALARTAAEAYHDARAVSAAPGIVMDELRKLGALAVADPAGTLKVVREVLDLPRCE